MTYESLLKGTSWKTLADEQDATTLAESKEAVKTAGSRLFITIDRLGRKIHGSFGDNEQVEANQAVTDMLTDFTDMLTGNRDQIMSGFTAQVGASQAQTQLESVRGQLSAAQQTNSELRTSADEASSLRDTVTDLTSKLERKDAELMRANARIRELEAEAAKPKPPNPLTGANRDLQTNLDAANAAKNEVEAENERLQQENNELRQQIDTPTNKDVDQPAEPSPTTDAAPSGTANEPKSDDQSDDKKTGILDGNGGLHSDVVQPPSGKPEPRRRQQRPGGRRSQS